MKKNEPYKRTMGQIIVTKICFLFALMLVTLVYCYIFPSFFKTRYLTYGTSVMMFFLIFIFYCLPTIILGVIFWFLSRYSRYPLRLDLYFEQKRIEGQEKYKERLLAQQAARKNQQKSYKESYQIQKILSGEHPFVFKLCLLQTIYRNTLPILRVNGESTGFEVVDKHTIRCCIKKAMRAEQKTILFSIGDNFMEMDNPYYMPSGISDHINWQCEGHGPERCIYLPKRYLPQTREDMWYEFGFRIHKKFFGNFCGRYDPTKSCIIIYLGRKVDKEDCASNKQNILHLTFGNKNEIILPAPVLLMRDYKFL